MTYLGTSENHEEIYKTCYSTLYDVIRGADNRLYTFFTLFIDVLSLNSSSLLIFMAITMFILAVPNMRFFKTQERMLQSFKKIR